VYSDSYGAGVPADEIDLAVIWYVVARYKLLIGLCVAICGIGAALFAFTATPQYRAEVTIADARESTMGNAGGISGQLGGLASLAGVTLGSGSGASREAHAILKSRQLAEQFVQRYELAARLMSDSSLQPTLWRSVARFQKDILNVDEDRRSGMVAVSVYWRDRKEAAQWANDYVALANEVIRKRAAADAQRNIGYLTEQMKLTGSVEVQHALANLIESETKTLMLAQGRADYAFTIIDPAVSPEVKASPKRAIILVVGIVAGIFAGVLIALARYKIARYRARVPAQTSGVERS
jgi:uncharacterized protein involved in exopolysaccharide biosynthesis